MIRTLALLVAILLQAVPAAVPGGLVLCIHEDGQWFLEPAAAPCCKGCPGAYNDDGTSPQSVADRSSTPGGDDDRCRDYVLDMHGDRTPVARVATAASPRSEQHSLPASALPCTGLALVRSSIESAARETGPPPGEAALARLRTIVLRC